MPLIIPRGGSALTRWCVVFEAGKFHSGALGKWHFCSRGLCVPILAAIGMFAALQLPPDTIYLDKALYAQVIHPLLELFSIITCALVITISWMSLGKSENDKGNILVFLFSIVLVSDVLHVLSYDGMPDFLTRNSVQKAIFFWLTGRLVEIAAMTAIAFGFCLPGPRRYWFLAAVVISMAVSALGLFHPDILPRTFVPGEGVTPFKSHVEIAFFLLNMLLAARLLYLYLTTNQKTNLYYSLSCTFIGLGGLAFTGYTKPSDFINILGHIYKILSYIYVFRAAFYTGLCQPYERLAASESQLAIVANELTTLMQNLPVGVVRLDRNFHCLYANSVFESSAGQEGRDMFDRPIEQTGDDKLAAAHQWRRALGKVLGGSKVEFEYENVLADGTVAYRSAIAVPERDADGNIHSILAIIVDTSERIQAQNLLSQSKNEILGLKAVLDAHAIVAITDHHGIITHVNDKFCEISQYSAEELIGHSHAMMSSGIHSKSFFDDMWRTIESGLVWEGEICNRAKDGSTYWVQTTIMPFTLSRDGPCQYIAIRADITKRKQAEQEVEHMAFHDALTGLPNRRLMANRLDRAITHAGQKERYGALLLLDLDHFKEINDTLGHAIGDDLLRNVTSQLREGLGRKSFIARFGGDEFAIVIEDLGGTLEEAMNQVSSYCERIQQIASKPCRLSEKTVSVTFSIGAVIFSSELDGADELFKRADIALYKAKEEGRNNYQFFDPSLQAHVTARTEMLRDLRDAISLDQLHLNYQPIVDVEGNIQGVEALLRWNHPERGATGPDIFIPLAEQNNLIPAIGQWVLEIACFQLREWAEDEVRSAWTMSVNVSAKQFNEIEFVNNVRRALEKTGADPKQLYLEITETLLHHDLEGTKGKMEELRDMGVRFSLDDFGTGYSSLRYLKQLPIDQLKIDKSFVRDLQSDANSAAIVTIILTLARSLNIRVVAEGVETLEQFAMLKGHDCHAYQGYLFSKPLCAEEINAASVCDLILPAGLRESGFGSIGSAMASSPTRPTDPAKAGIRAA